MNKFLKNILVYRYNDYFLNYEKLFTTGEKVNLVICNFLHAPVMMVRKNIIFY
jgi:hypothetical protein